MQCQKLARARARRVAASNKNDRAILSWSTPNPVGPYKLVTPIAPPTGVGKTKTPVMPVMGGPLVNLPTPVMPTKQTTPVAPPMADKLVNVPKQQGRVVDASKTKPTDPDDDFYNWAESAATKWAKQYETAGSRFTGTIRDIEDQFTDRVYKRVKDANLAQSLSEDLHDGIFGSAGQPDVGARVLDTYLKTTKGMTKQEDAIFHKLLPTLERIHMGVNSDRHPQYNAVEKYWISGTGGGIREAYIRHAADVTKSIAKLNPKEKETFIALFPEWTGTPAELANAARSLSK